MLLKFSQGNAKLSDSILIFSLPAGHTCPGALKCLSKADQTTGKITDGSKMEFRCYAASQEATYGTVRTARWYNWDLLQQHKTFDEKLRLLLNSLEYYFDQSAKIKSVRVHGSGDFFNQEYFDAWMRAAELFSDKRFYAYTKALNFWVDYMLARMEDL